MRKEKWKIDVKEDTKQAMNKYFDNKPSIDDHHGDIHPFLCHLHQTSGE